MISKRKQIMYIGMRDFLGLVQGELRIEDIPEGTKFVTANFSFERHSFEVLLTNEDWPEVPDSVIPPRYTYGFRILKGMGVGG